MPQRNGQNPIRAAKSFGHTGNKFNDPVNPQAKNAGAAVTCPACKTEVPPKPGFRLSSLKCPGCGASLGRK